MPNETYIFKNDFDSIRAIVRVLMAALVTLPPVFIATTEASANRLSGSAKQSFSIPEQPLDDAIDAFIAASNWQVGFPAALTQGLRSVPVNGSYTPQQTLKRLLTGSGLTYKLTGANTVTLEKIAAAAPVDETDSQAGTTLPKVKVTTTTRFDAQDPYNPDYNRPNATTATRTDTPIMETPVSIEVVPQQVLKDQQAIRLQDALQNVSGVRFIPSSGNLVDNFVIRGFNVGTEGRLRNGRRFPGFFKVDFANIEQVEVLKGPASVLFGRLNPGGAINLITKKPLNEPYYALQQQFGSYDFYRTTVDATGPIDADKTLLYRFNLGYTDAESFRDELFNRALLISPSLTWRPWESTEINLNYEYRHEDILFDSGIPVGFADGNNHIPPISRRSQFSEPSSPDALEYHLVDFNWSHRFNALNADWTVRNGFQYQRNNLNFREISADTVRTDGRTLDRFVFFADAKQDQYSVFLNLTGKFQVWGTDHTVLVGWDYYNEETSFPQKFSSAGQDTSIDLFNPVLGRVDVNAINVLPFEFFSKFGNRWHGVYFQDQLSLFDNRLHILGGGRYDWTEAFSGDSAVSLGDIKLDTINNTITARKFSPRVGVVYQPWAWLSLYGNYVESLGANNGQPTASGSPLPPQEGEQHEVGIKTAFFDGRLSSTLAFFDLRRTNIPAPDLSTPNRSDRVAIGEARSRGIELDISGQLTDRLNLIGTYAFTDAKITKDAGQDALGNPTAGSTGDRLPGAPRHQGSLFAKYQVLPERFEIGSGIFLASNSSPGVGIKTVDVPGFVRWDAFAAYHMSLGKARLTAQVNVNNILDKRYFHPTGNGGGPVLFPGDTRTVLGSLRVEY